MKCEYTEKQIVRYLDGEMNDKEFVSAREHINNCLSCKKFYEDCIFMDNCIENFQGKQSYRSFNDLRKLLPLKSYSSKSTAWVAAACLFVAVILGSCIGLCNQFEFGNNDYSDYTGYKVTYVSMLENFSDGDN